MEDLRDHIDSTSSMKSIIFVDNIIYGKHTCMDVLSDDIIIVKDDKKYIMEESDAMDAKSMDAKSMDAKSMDAKSMDMINDIDNSKIIMDIDNQMDIDNSNIIMDIENQPLVKIQTQTFTINRKVKDGKSPCDFLSETLMIGNNREIMLNMIYEFMGDKRVMKKFTKKVISSVMEGLSSNKWNINVCTFFHFLLDIDFIYRKRLIGSNEINAYKC